MTEKTSFRQSKAGYKRVFTFDSEMVSYEARDSSGSAEFSVPYEALDFSSISTVTLNKTPLTRRLFILGLMLFIAGLTTTSLSLPDEVTTPLLGVLWTASTLIFCTCIANLRTGWLAAKFTILRIAPPMPGSKNGLMVLHDKQYDAVMGELRKRWKERLKTRFGQANPHADPQQEAARLAWLRDREVIDEAHYQGELGKLAAPDIAMLQPPRTLN